MNLFKYLVLAMFTISSTKAMCNCTPSQHPTSSPTQTYRPTPFPTPFPTQTPTLHPSFNTTKPTTQPTSSSTQHPSFNTTKPTAQPTQYTSSPSHPLTAVTTTTNPLLVTALTVSAGAIVFMALIYSILKIKCPSCFSNIYKPIESNINRI